MDIQLSHAANAAPGPLRTRRPVSGLMAHSVAVPILHVALARARASVVHQVETEMRTTWEVGGPATLPASADETVRVLVPTGQRAQWLAVALVYLADPGAILDLSLYTTAGVLLDGPITMTGGTLPSTQIIDSTLGAGLVYRYAQGWASTGDVQSAGATVRPLIVPAANRGTTLEVRCAPAAPGVPGARVQVLSVAVYELAEATITA